jgi:hypothetical protein
VAQIVDGDPREGSVFERFSIADREDSRISGVMRRSTRGKGAGRVDIGLFGYLTILAAVLELVFAACVFAFISRLEARTPARLGEKVGAHKAVLAKLRKRESMSRDEVDYATELISDSRSLLAYSIPAALFTMGCFYIVGCLEELHGGTPSVRTFIGVIPMLTSTNLTIQLLRVARLKGRLQDVSLTVPNASDVVTTA